MGHGRPQVRLCAIGDLEVLLKAMGDLKLFCRPQGLLTLNIKKKFYLTLTNLISQHTYHFEKLHLVCAVHGTEQTPSSIYMTMESQ